jgi:hypothetical protein
MSTLNGTKINKLLSMQPPGTVMLSSWLVEQGYSHDLSNHILGYRFDFFQKEGPVHLHR